MNAVSFPNRLPGRAIAALWVSAVFLGLTVVGLLQTLNLRHEVSYAQQSLVDVVLWVGVAEFALLLAATILVGTKVTAVPLTVLAAIGLGLSVFSVGKVSALSLVSSVAPLVAILVLLRSADVRRFFAARKWYRQNTRLAAQAPAPFARV